MAIKIKQTKLSAEERARLRRMLYQAQKIREIRASGRDPRKANLLAILGILKPRFRVR